MQTRTESEHRNRSIDIPAAVDRSFGAIAGGDRVDAIGRTLQQKLNVLLRRPAILPIKDFLNGTWLGHPLHPAITDIPVGAWTAAAAFDVLGIAGRRGFDRAAKVALGIGIGGAIGSALTGLADWADTGSRQRRVGLVHAGLNSAALILQIGSLLSRPRHLRRARTLSAAGLALTGVAAYLGGVLVFDQGTQVNRRANARGARKFTRVLAEADLPAEQPVRAEVDGKGVLLVKHRGEIFALDDTCSHAGCPLSGGRLEADAIVCPCHGSTFRLRDGAVVHGPSPFRQPCYDVRIVDGQIEVRRRVPLL